MLARTGIRLLATQPLSGAASAGAKQPPPPLVYTPDTVLQLKLFFLFVAEFIFHMDPSIKGGKSDQFIYAQQYMCD